MILVDAHLHLASYPDDPEPLLRAARARDMYLISCTTRLDEVVRNLGMRKGNSRVKCFLGVHPSEASTAPRPSEAMDEVLLSESDGIGEIGLDPRYAPKAPWDAQMDAFLDQVRIAERLGKPVEVHSRGAVTDCLRILGSFTLPSVLLHWFDGEHGALREATARGYFVSFGPALLYSKRLQRIAALTSRESILTESDGPIGFKPLWGLGGPNLIASVIFKLAELRRESFEEMAAAIEGNIRAFLRAR